MPIAVWAPTPGLPLARVRPAPIFTPEIIPAKWRFAYGPWNALPTTELPTITGRSVTFRLTGNHEAAFTVDGTLDETAGLQELVSDLWIYRNRQALFRGRLGGETDTVGPDGDVSFAYSAADYRAILSRRELFDTDTLAYPTQDKSAIAWALVAQTQAQTAGSLGIVRGVGQTTGQTQASTFTAGSMVADNINQIAQAANGFDWDITPTAGSVSQTFDVFYPQRGTDRQKIVDYPGQIVSFTRSVDPGAFANVLRVTGTTGLGAQTVASPTLATDPAGRWESQYGDTNIITTGQLSSTATQQLAASQLVIPSWTVTLQPDLWAGPSDVWLGDPVTLAATYGSRNVLETLRVVELKVDLDDNSDAATVSLTLGSPPPSNRWLLRHFDRRLTALEKR